ncbi:hypothetical protein GOBAR_AA08338 [Gossypium barbadense]|uniref:RecF/RecN/SMC N-terminal domain-containing protein n=1 Tax=Gossypium barbadense TaxID=3634 RepID=A0A2P5Y9Q3_GOSBA|nr:hypothetical protein GOBAR_AA08338 [Gossypium barbadense]
MGDKKQHQGYAIGVAFHHHHQHSISNADFRNSEKPPFQSPTPFLLTEYGGSKLRTHSLPRVLLQTRDVHQGICFEGFKSYASRTLVPGFDPFFNSISGLNGSGKSNILDSICFVLGITNLQQVRAANLQELVYKQGQAGITKATVSIIFDNSDRSQSPLGYEDHSEITGTRQVGNA